MERLQRQRTLLLEHLRWLESEIAAEAASVPPTKSPEIALQPAAAPATAAAPGLAASEPVIAVPEADVRGIHGEVRSGCLLYFAIAFVTLGAVVGFIYWRY